MSEFDFNNLAGLIDTNLLEFTEESQAGINRAKLIQGNSEFEKDPQLNKTVRYLGGIGLSLEGLDEKILKKSTIVTNKFKDKSTDYAAFEKLETVILASARTRRFYGDVEGARKLMCGTNRDGQGAKGWRGVACVACEYHSKHFQGQEEDGCKGSIEVLVYFPELDHTAILTLNGSSYIPGSDWLNQIGKLSHDFAKRPEIQQVQPGVARVNSYFFKTVLSAGKFQTGEKGPFQSLEYTKASAPYQWSELVNSGEVIGKCKKILEELQDIWKKQYVDHNAGAVLSLPSPDATPALTGGTAIAALPGAVQDIGKKVEVLPPEAKPAPVATGIPQVSTIALDDEPEGPAAIEEDPLAAWG